MAALTSATLQPFPDPGLGRDAKSMCVFFWTKEESWRNRGTFGHPRPLSHLEELLGIVLPGWQAHDKLLAVLLHHQRAGEHLSVCLHSWLVQLGFSLRLCWGKELHGFFKTNPAVGIHAVCAKGWEFILKWIWEGQCYYPFSEGLSKALQWCPPVEKKIQKGLQRDRQSFPLALSCIWCKAGGRVGNVSEIIPTVPGFWWWIWLWPHPPQKSTFPLQTQCLWKVGWNDCSCCNPLKGAALTLGISRVFTFLGMSTKYPHPNPFIVH